MMGDVWTVTRKELLEAFIQRANTAGGRRGGWFSVIIVLNVFGIFFPLLVGPVWVTRPELLIVWSWMPMFLTTSLATDTFAGERERHTLETLLASRLSDRDILLGKLAAAVIYGWGLSLLSSALSLLVVNLFYGQGHFPYFYPLDVLALGLVLGLLGAGLSATAGVVVSMRAVSARQAAQIMNTVIMLLLFVPFLAVTLLPGLPAAAAGGAPGNGPFDTLAAGVAVVLAILDAVLLVVGLARFQRAKLILD